MPEKAARLKLEDDGDLLWEYQIAERLGMVIADVRAMPNEEFVSWQAYFLWKRQVQQITKR